MSLKPDADVDAAVEALQQFFATSNAVEVFTTTQTVCPDCYAERDVTVPVMSWGFTFLRSTLLCLPNGDQLRRGDPERDRGTIRQCMLCDWSELQPKVVER